MTHIESLTNVDTKCKIKQSRRCNASS